MTRSLLTASLVLLLATCSESTSDRRSDADAPAGDPGPLLPRTSIEHWEAVLVDPSGTDVTRAVGGAIVLVARAASEVYGIGRRAVGEASPPDGATCFQIGSVSKVYTGLILAGMVEQSAVDATDGVNLHLNGITVPAAPWGQTVTLEGLASHTAGLVTFPDNPTGVQPSPFADYTREDLRVFLEESPVADVFTAQAGYSYSNLGVGLLGIAMVEAAGLPSFGALLSRDIVGPMGMTRTGLNAPAFVSQIESNLAVGYWPNAGSLVPYGLSDMGVLSASGEIISCADDLARFLRVMVGLDPHTIDRAVERTTTVVADRPGPDQYIGYGWDILAPAGEAPRYEKVGVTAGFTTVLTFRREPPVGVAVVVNRGQMQPAGTAARALLAELEASL